jgi:hypothetical protein
MANSGRIIKVQLGGGFTVIPNSVAQSKELSLEEKGLLLFLNSLPETFVIYKSNLHLMMGELEGTVDRVFKSLRLKGYIASEKTHKDNGDFEGWQHRFSLDPNELLARGTNSEVAESAPIIKKQDTKDIYIKETYPIFVSYYNDLFQRKSRGCKKSKSQYSARVKEGYKIEDLKKALKSLHEDSFHKDNNYCYATLEFITRGDKLERFVSLEGANDLTKFDTKEKRYNMLLERIKQRPFDETRFTLEERRFMILYQSDIDRFPPDDRKMISDLTSYTKAEQNIREAAQWKI